MCHFLPLATSSLPKFSFYPEPKFSFYPDPKFSFYPVPEFSFDDKAISVAIISFAYIYSSSDKVCSLIKKPLQNMTFLGLFKDRVNIVEKS